MRLDRNETLLGSFRPLVRLVERSKGAQNNLVYIMNVKLTVKCANVVMQTRKKSVEVDGEKQKPAKSSGSKKTGGKKLDGGCSANVWKHEDDSKVGSAAWVTKEMESVGLHKYVARLATEVPLELLVHADSAQLDLVLHATSKNQPFPDTIDYIKLQCVIRAMHVKVTGNTGSPNLSQVGVMAGDDRKHPSFVDIGGVVSGIGGMARFQSRQSEVVSSSPPSSSSSSSKNVPSMVIMDVPTLLQGDILQWNVAAAQTWMQSIPALHRFCASFESLQMDGHRLLRLNDRKLLQRMKIESDSDRALILQHVGDLKALQLTRAASAHSDILNKLIDGLASELAQLNKVSSSSSTNPAVSNMLIASKRVPNFFLSLRIGCLDLRSKVKRIQSEIEALIPDLAGSRSMLPPEQLHFTLGRLYLQTEAEIALAKKLLEECHETVYKRLYPDGAEVAVNFRGVMNYGGNTVFLETERGNERDLLIEFGNTVYEMFQAAGLTSKEFRFQPVAPILRVRQSKKPLMMKLEEVSTTLLETYSDASLGRNVFSTLDISAVADQTDADGYYRNLHTVALK
jgi:2'-5' RNA ligase